MGNTLNTTELSHLQEQRGTLDLSLNVNYDQYCQHALGLPPQGCLTNLATRLPASPSLYSGLNASFNWLSEIPPTIPERLPHLVILDLSHNRLTTIQDAILLALPHLRDISFSHNLLNSLPQSLHLLPKLIRLDCSHNGIEFLPSTLGSCPSLRALDCSRNRLKQLPTTLGKSHTLRLLLADGNPCVTPPKDTCEKGSEETLKYLRALAYGLDPCAPLSIPNIQENGSLQKLIFPRVLGGVTPSTTLSTTNTMGAGGLGGGKDAWSREQYMEMQGRQLGMQTARGLRTPLFPPPGSTSLDALELRDKIAGLLFGAAIGDSIGLATEFLSPDECMFHYSPLCGTTNFADKDLPLLHHNSIIRDGHRVRWQRGEWTSHCEIMLLVLDSIIQWGGVVDELDFALRLRTWAEAQGIEGRTDTTEPNSSSETNGRHSHISSPIIQKVVSRPNFSSFPHDAAQSVWKESMATNCAGIEESTGLDNGSLPQSIVLGIPHFYNLMEVSSNSSRICLTLHQDPACVAASVATSVIVAQLLKGKLIGGQGKREESVVDDLDSLFLGVRDVAMPYLKGCDTKVQAAFEACFRPCSESELKALVTREVHHPFTTLSVAAYTLRVDKMNAAKGAEAKSAHSGGLLSTLSGNSPMTAVDEAGDSCCVDGCASGGLHGKLQRKELEQGKAFRRGVSQVALLCGHASANCCLSGALLGCIHGYSSLPEQWVEGLNPSKRAMLTSRTNALLNIMALP